MRETGLIDAWREDVEVASQQTMRAEVELWYRDDPQKRATAQARVESTLGALNGRVIASTAVPQILHHGLLVEIPRAHVEQVVRDGAGAIDLLTVEDIMFVAPSAQHAVRTPEWRGRLPEHAVDEQTPHGEPRVALIDGLPLANHVVLRDRLVIDDPDDAAAHYRASQQRHATAMASLIAHGTLDNPGSALTHQLYVRPVLRPQSFPTESEVFPDDALLIDILHRALIRLRLFDLDSGVLGLSLAVALLIAYEVNGSRAGADGHPDERWLGLLAGLPKRALVGWRGAGDR